MRTLVDYLKTCADMGSPAVEQELYGVPHVRCIHVNKAALFDRYPCFRKSRSDRELFEWLEVNLGLISKTQFESRGKFFDVEHNSLACKGHRQKHMGRTAVVCRRYHGQAVLFELKGCGVDGNSIAVDDDHSNGFINIFPAFKEYCFSNLLMQMNLTSEKWRPQEIYAMLMYPFVATRKRKRIFPVILVREPVIRKRAEKWPFFGSPDWKTMIDVEVYLQDFGITTALLDSRFRMQQGCYSDASQIFHMSRFEYASKNIDEHVRRAWTITGKPFPYTAFMINVQLNSAFMKQKGETKERVLTDMEHFKPITRLAKGSPLFIPCGDLPFGYGGEVPRNSKTSHRSRKFTRIHSAYALVDGGTIPRHLLLETQTHGRVYAYQKRIASALDMFDRSRNVKQITETINYYLETIDSAH
jgi:hypothetical protein